MEKFDFGFEKLSRLRLIPGVGQNLRLLKKKDFSHPKYGESVICEFETPDGVKCEKFVKKDNKTLLPFLNVCEIGQCMRLVYNDSGAKKFYECYKLSEEEFNREG